MPSEDRSEAVTIQWPGPGPGAGCHCLAAQRAFISWESLFRPAGEIPPFLAGVVFMPAFCLAQRALVDDSKKTFVFIAGGIGITPFRAILLDLDYNKKPLNVQLLYANRDNDFPYRKELDALRGQHAEFRIDYVVSPNRIDEKSIPQLVPDIEKPMLYVSGPEPMVESMDETLKTIGVPEGRIKNDFFPGYEWP